MGQQQQEFRGRCLALPPSINLSKHRITWDVAVRKESAENGGLCVMAFLWKFFCHSRKISTISGLSSPELS